MALGRRAWWPVMLLVGGVVAGLFGPQKRGAVGAEPAAAAEISFNRDVRPILSSKCFACHGFDAKKRQADLRLDVPEGALAERDGRRAIVPGKPQESELWRRITSTDDSERMPPPETKKTLTDQERQILRRWIEAGAPYQKHWAFEPIQRPPVPSQSPGRSPIDAFLEARLRAEGLTPQPPADKETLIRRVALTLTGLPPTLEEVDAFLSDTSEGAYERMVDRYLQSPRYGEEMARHWLDVARYADTHGLHLDNERQMWAYRDWVVRAFNENLPFDQFTIWQVAGDLLPEPTLDQQIATGFLRCNVTTSEGGSIEAEFVYRYAVERATAVAQAWMGLTVGCAVCHDHKYDPISMREFYSLYAFFHSAADPAMDGNVNNTPPFLKLLTPQQRQAAEAAGKVEQQARAWLDVLAGQCAYEDPAEARSAPPRQPVRDVLFDEVFPPGTATRSSSRNAIVTVLDPPVGAPSGRRVIKQAYAVTLTDTIEPKLRPLVVPHEGQIEAWVYLDPRDVPKSISLGLSAPGRRGGKSVQWQRTEDGRTLARAGQPDQRILAGQWTRLSIAVGDLGLEPGDPLAGLALSQTGGVCYWDAVAVVGQTEPAKDPLCSLSVWRQSVGSTPPPETPADVAQAIRAGPKQELSAGDLDRLRRFYLAVVARPVTPELAAARATWETARTMRLSIEESAPGTFVFRDLPTPRQSFVMLRGQYDKPGEQVQPDVPAILPPIRRDDPQRRLSRLDLARWLVAPENPLTARVAVNRFWQQVFGTGLVKTSYDFGSQGEPPSHPELLDWLASDFRDSGWDVKRLMKALVMTEAFQRQAAVTPQMLARDPANRLLARGPRLRLDAEQIRDNALFVSGLIDLRMGGPGVKPYQPPNIWEPVGYGDSNTRFYLQDHGPALYRRSLYVFLKRTAPPPFMTNFDGPNREQVCMVRERSNTPLQALQLMNDVQHFEAARALAERTLAEGGASDESRLVHLFRTVLSRRPDAEELRILQTALDRQRAIYRADVEAARRAIAVGESHPRNLASPDETAAWTMVANLVLNLDETICRN